MAEEKHGHLSERVREIPSGVSPVPASLRQPPHHLDTNINMSYLLTEHRRIKREKGKQIAIDDLAI